MSLVATWVKADDGLFYEDPTLADNTHDWFICFDDDDPPELVIKVRTGKSTTLKPEAIFKQIGLDAKVTAKNGVAGRLFGPDRDDFKFSDGRSYWIEIRKPIPHKFISEHEGRQKTSDNILGVIYDFEGNES